MTLIVKIMSGENLADDNTQKSYRLFTGVKFVDFHRRKGAPIAEIVFADEAEPSEFDLDGNVYVMNQNGKTVASFGASPPAEIHHPQCEAAYGSSICTCGLAQLENP